MINGAQNDDYFPWQTRRHCIRKVNPQFQHRSKHHGRVNGGNLASSWVVVIQLPNSALELGQSAAFSSGFRIGPDSPELNRHVPRTFLTAPESTFAKRLVWTACSSRDCYLPEKLRPIKTCHLPLYFLKLFPWTIWMLDRMQQESQLQPPVSPTILSILAASCLGPGNEKQSLRTPNSTAERSMHLKISRHLDICTAAQILCFS